MKKILFSLVAANFAVLAFVFSVTPKEAKADVDNRWDAMFVPCQPPTNPPTEWNYCYRGSEYVFCANGPCAITLPPIDIR